MTFLSPRSQDTWLVVDETYYQFLYEGVSHSWACSHALEYENIVHVFSMSKSYGMPGWRVGYTGK